MSIEINKKISFTLLLISYIILILVYWTVYIDMREPNEEGIDPVGILFRFGIELKQAISTSAFLYIIVIFLNRHKILSVSVFLAIIGLVILLSPVLLLEFLNILGSLRQLRGVYS